MTHGFGCRSRTWKTRCGICGRAVFFFTCDCGCKVYFDELGPPWPRHECGLSRVSASRAAGASKSLEAEYAELLRRQENISRHNSSVFDAESMRMSMLTPCELEPDYAETVLRKQAAPQERTLGEESFAILPEDPYRPELSTKDYGVVRELLEERSLFDYLRLPETTLTAQLLKPYLRRSYAQATAFSRALTDESFSSYTFLLDRKRLECGLEKGDLVRFSLETIGFGETIRWICTDLEIVGKGGC